MTLLQGDQNLVAVGAVIAISMGLIEVVKSLAGKLGNSKQTPSWVREDKRDELLREMYETQRQLCENQTKQTQILERMEKRCEVLCQLRQSA